MTRTVSYAWNLRQLMAERGMFATTDLVPLLAERGVELHYTQVYRLVTGTPERLNMQVLAALCDILDVTPADLISTAAQPGTRRARRTGTTPGHPADPAGPADTASRPSAPTRARIVRDEP
ncbi:helix-turn-helix transcriptional regulator [Pseudonocardia sp. WMMC193]|uniref:helix-turn-helix domain-containing protein n=1 Tax=Pseudonocardia sp. WMMC193 TaxID=2911965 RepID=UPI001F45B418|nr:helix-turn-helix transcriptional regulator [Pseudonocardia sp. WMMC193]MCF7552663.1 helix-turn-helix transcriptional regulator [Pseudonocardia sp. WMMC193]